MHVNPNAITEQKCVDLYHAESTFHIHPKALIHNFLSHRFLHKPSMLITNDKECTSDYINTLRFYGYYSTIIALPHIKEIDLFAYITSAVAMECVDQIFNNSFINDPIIMQDGLMSVALVLIDLIKKKDIFIHHKQYRKYLLETFLYHFICLNFYKYRRNKCEYYYSRKYKACGLCLSLFPAQKAHLGYLMVFAADYIHNLLQSLSLYQLKQMMFAQNMLLLRTLEKRINIIQKKWQKDNIKKQLLLTAGNMKTWSVEHIRNIGKLFVMESFD